MEHRRSTDLRQNAQLVSFLSSLAKLTASDIEAAHATLRGLHATAADDVAACSATFAIDRELRRHRLSREGASAARLAQDTVRRVAVLSSLTLPDDGVTFVARSSAEIARAIVAGSSIGSAASETVARWTAAVLATVLEPSLVA